MKTYPEYKTPVETISVETEVKKSKFISTISSVSSKEEFISFSKKIQSQYPNANHNCFAYIVGDPESPKYLGLSDAGEPSGTAGKPIMTILQHNNMGNVVLFVTRFFGGIKLGTGGLVRAYSTAAQKAVEKVTVKKKVQSKRLQVCFPFPFESGVRHLFSVMGIHVIESRYSEKVIIKIDVPLHSLDDLQNRLNDVTKGRNTYL